MRISNNPMAINAYNQLSGTTARQGKALEKLSSGFRINRAGDDAAGLVISEKLRSQIGGMKQATRNTLDAVSMVQTAEGALTEVHAMLQRTRDLAVQASNDSNDATARKAIQSEINQLGDQIDNVILGTEFNGTKLFGGGDAAAYKTARDTMAAATEAWEASPQAAGDITTLNAAVTAFKTAKAGMGEGQALNFQVGANNSDTDVLTLKAQNLSSVLGAVRGNAPIASKDATVTTAIPSSGANVATHKAAKASIDNIDAHIATVSAVRGELGATQNRLEHTVNSLKVSTENLTASESRIRDTDMAEEMMRLTREQILNQAGTAMMAQANQVPQGVLSLLR